MHNISIFFTKTFDKICLMRMGCWQFIVKWNAKSGRNRLRLKHGRDPDPDLSGPKQSKSKERSNIITHVSLYLGARQSNYGLISWNYSDLLSPFNFWKFNFYLSTANIRRRREKYSVSLTSKLCARKMSRGAITFHIWNF